MILLIAEDNFDQQAVYKECIAELDSSIKIMFALNGYDLLGLLANCEFEGCIPELVLLDLNMPHMDGRAVLAKLKDDKRLNTVKVVILTESKNQIDRYIAKLYKTPYFIKSQDKDECIKVLKTILNMDTCDQK